VIAGALFDLRAPVATLSPLGYADAALEPGAQLEFGTEFEQRAIYIAAGALESHGRRLEAARLLVLRANERVSLTTLVRSRIMLFGGRPLDGPRYVWWNFVSSSRERIEQAKAAWRDRQFERVPGDEHEFIPLPAEAGVAVGARSSPEGSAL
jgi:redox-sensitive bicupin YhaK (pirin superfamily)